MTRIVFVAANPSVDRFLEVDSIQLGAIHRPDSVVAVAGGKGLNAARAAAALGGSVEAIALVGGHAGAWIGVQLADLGIRATLIDSGGETRTCVSVLDRSTGRLTEFYEGGSTVSPTGFDGLVRAARTNLERGDVGVLVMSGSLPPGAPRDGYAGLVRNARDCGVATILDTHGEALANALAAGPAIVKVNADEAAEASGMEIVDASTAVNAAQSIRAAGAERVVVTIGRDGAVVVDEGGVWRLSSSADGGPYSVGSGDAFGGGLAVALARGDPFVDGVRLGMAAAIANARMAGAGLLDADEVARVLPTVDAAVLRGNRLAT